MSISQKELAEELKVQWKKLWQERVDDKLRAEGIATDEYVKLFVERGTIIHATRDYKALNFREILKQNQIENIERYVSPSPQIGGWGKFIKTSIANMRRSKIRRPLLHYQDAPVKQQPKKGGRGWLHK